MRNVAAYIRVSTAEQARQGYSIESQRQVLRDYAAGHALDIVQEFVESESAYKPGREGFRAMLAFLKRHRDVSGVLCYKIDRIARNLQDYATLTELMRIEIISATEFLPPGATGEYFGGLQAVGARFYSSQLSERVSLGLETKARKGLWPTYAPSGYNNEGKGIEPDHVAGPLITALFDRFAEGGLSIEAATEWAKNRGLRSRYGNPLVRSAIHGILTNPLYYGALPWKGKLYQGQHEPLTSKVVFDRVQEHLQDRAPKKTVRCFPYRGLMECGYCGCRITAEIKKGKYVYYRCTYGRGRDCVQPYHRQESVSKRFAAVIDQISLSQEIAAKIMRLVEEDGAGQQERKLHRIKQLEHESEKLTSLRDAAYEDKLRGRISEARWVHVDERFDRQLQIVCEEHSLLTSETDVCLDDVAAALELLQRAPELYRKHSHEERALLLESVVSNSVLTAENLIPIYRKPFDAVAEGKRTGDWLGEEDSNPH